ncbi:MAG: DUF362 domain-containing protein [Victivallaceae bacterium]|nr:DUF362 domain-containing protein [Victivallaceae bacterium]
MERRTFLKNTAAAGIAGGIALNLSGVALEEKKKAPVKKGGYDLVAVKGGEPEEMFERGIAALGGMKTFVKPGQTVVVKPNIGWARTPEAAANTNPGLVKRIVEHCIKAGAKTVYVLDHTCNAWKDCYEKSGISEAAQAGGAKVVCGNHRQDYREVDVPEGKRLKKTSIHSVIMDCDVFINVPILKNHGGAVMTCAMKNLMGIVWDRGYFHRNDLQQCIADCITARKPDLNIVDAYRVMKKGGPRGRSLADVAQMKYQLLSTDIVAVDTAASKILGISSDRIGHLRLGEELKLGTMNLDKLKVERITI